MINSTLPDQAPALEKTSFVEQITATFGKLSPAEQRVARCLVEQKDAVLLGSAAEIAVLAGTSDATVVRTVRSLGFAGLAELRQALLSDITGVPSPGGRLLRTLDEAGKDSAQALRHVMATHDEALAAMRMAPFEASFARAVDLLFAAKRRHIFGVGPSGMLADYARLQFNRIGLASSALTASGIGLADGLLGMNEGDAVLMLAYAPSYREVELVLDRAEALGNPVVLLSDNLGPFVASRVAEILPVPRGRADHLSMHAGTMVLIEALIIALAARDREKALTSLEMLSQFRGAIDKTWLKRGVKAKTS
ncbi:MAG TPA: MurR/RpiR family transcriptional regulator [Arsenicitalea sp.]|jgi:DNA-binding MurR/RpiR family transcriptional regulator|nr:MurR/RpiR family transcriptional regulator [Arsenicitalea sp.]